MTTTPESRERLTVLVADDSAIYRKLVEQTLPPEQYNHLFAKNGREAIDLFSEHHPSLVITDWTMPDISGIDFCAWIRRDFAEFFTYVIILTGNTSKEQMIEGLAAGADDYLTKPFHPGELLARIGVGRRMIDFHRQIEAKNRLLAELALTDTLTGLSNRRAVDLWVIPQLSATARHKFPIWVVTADLDLFKSINDNFGHQAGDKVIKTFAEILKKNTRSSNICGRIGGEEFVVVMTHIEKANAAIAMERVRQQFEAQRFTFAGRTFNATASFGIAGLQPDKTPDFKELLARADAALYLAKRNGRNRIEFEIRP